MINSRWWWSSRLGKFQDGGHLSSCACFGKIQDGGGHLFPCTDASVDSPDGDHASLFLMVLRYKIQDGARATSLKFNVAAAFSHNILHTLYFFRNFSSTSLFDDFDSTDASFGQMLRYL